MTQVIRREGEDFDQLVRRFKTAMDKSGVLREFKRRQRFHSEAELRRMKAKAAERRRTSRMRTRRDTERR